MKRQDKYPDTATFHYFNANPKNRITGDCWARAVCTGLDEPYADTVMGLAQICIETGYDPTSNKAVEKYLASKGWIKHGQPRKANGTKYTGDEFCRVLAKKKERYIANIGGHHMVAIVDGKVQDIWNSTGGCIGVYWSRSL